MTTYLLTIDGPEAFASAVADHLADDARLGADAAGAFDLGGGGWRAEAYFSARPEAGVLDRLAVLLAAGGHDAGAVATRLAGAELRPLDGADFAAIGLDGLPPIAAGRFRVYGEHNRPAGAAALGRGDLVIEAATAFGTGDHASTYLTLLGLDAALKCCRPARVLDLGTGTGILGLALAKAAPAARILASDIEPVAVRMAEVNRRGNAVGDSFRAMLADGLGDARFRVAGPFDLVLANILPDPLTRLAGPVVRLMAPGGRLIVAGLRIGEEARLVAAYRARGLVLLSRRRAKEWSSLSLFRPPRRPR